jgi:hypothetical protein
LDAVDALSFADATANDRDGVGSMSEALLGCRVVVSFVEQRIQPFPDRFHHVLNRGRGYYELLTALQVA